MHHLTKIITDGMSALLYVLCVQFSSFLLWCQCRLANQIRQFIKCCGVQIHLPCISGLALYHGFQDENPRETESNVVVIVYNCYSNLRYQNLPPESKAYFTNICFWKKKSALQATFLSCCLLSFPGRSPLTGLLLICSWPTLTIALQLPLLFFPCWHLLHHGRLCSGCLWGDQPWKKPSIVAKWERFKVPLSNTYESQKLSQNFIVIEFQVLLIIFTIRSSKKLAQNKNYFFVENKHRILF